MNNTSVGVDTFSLTLSGELCQFRLMHFPECREVYKRIIGPDDFSSKWVWLNPDIIPMLMDEQEAQGLQSSQNYDVIQKI
jgi:hypothetical protein